MEELIFLPLGQFQSSEDDMKLREDDKKWLTAEITKQITVATDALADSLRPHGWRRFTHWLREWGLAATAIAAPLTLLAISVAVGIFAASAVKENGQFRTHTEDRLTNIESSLKNLDSSFRAIRLRQLSVLVSVTMGQANVQGQWSTLPYLMPINPSMRLS